MHKIPISHVLLAIAVIAILLGWWRANHDLATLREENDQLRNALSAAENKFYAYAADPASNAIRALSAAGTEYHDVLFAIIGRWGELKYQAKELQIPGEENVHRLHIFHAEKREILDGDSAHNTTIALLADESNNLIDAIWYDSDLATEFHRCNFQDEVVPSIRLSRFLRADRRFSTILTASEWIQWNVTANGFSKESGVYSVPAGLRDGP